MVPFRFNFNTSILFKPLFIFSPGRIMWRTEIFRVHTIIIVDISTFIFFHDLSWARTAGSQEFESDFISLWCLFISTNDIYTAAFDTLDHVTLLERLEVSLGLTDSALEWLRSYMTDRSQRVCMNGIYSPYHTCPHGLPQGSVFEPILFSLFVVPVAHVIRSFDLTFHQYADDTQLYINVDRRNIATSLDSLERCTGELEDWFTHNGLALNPFKSEVMFLGTRPQIRAVGQVSVVKVAGHEIHLSDDIKNLGVISDSDLTFSKHADSICKAYTSTATRETIYWFANTKHNCVRHCWC